jgi:hypothetical protein
MAGTLLGTDLSGSFTTDIDGDTRVDWYAGADEIVGGGQTGTPAELICINESE